MNKRIILFFGIILSLFLIVFCFIYFAFSSIDFESKERLFEISFPEVNEHFLFDARAWGISGNHEEIVLSNHEIAQNPTLRKENNYIFYSSPVFYLKKKNKLIIYCPASGVSKPKNFKTNIEIDIKSLKNSKEILDFERNYKKKGLTKVSAY